LVQARLFPPQLGCQSLATRLDNVRIGHSCSGDHVLHTIAQPCKADKRQAPGLEFVRAGDRNTRNS